MSSESVLCMITWNARSLRKEERQQELVEFLERKGVDVCALQETWLPGASVQEIERSGHLFVLENHDGQQGMRKGVGLVLSRRSVDAWDAAGRKKWVSECRRLLAVRLVFEDDQGRKVSVVVMSGYRPLSSDALAQEQFDENVVNMFDSFAPGDVVVFGADVNGSVGVNYDRIIGRYGLPRTNSSGLAFRQTMQAVDCASSTSFFDPGPWGGSLEDEQNRVKRQVKAQCKAWRASVTSVAERVKRATRKLQRRLRKAAGPTGSLSDFWERQRRSRFTSWTHMGEAKTQHHLDFWWVKRADLRRVKVAKVLAESLGSDHQMVMLKLRVACRLSKVSHNQAPPKERVYRDKLLEPETRARFIECVRKLMDERDARSCESIDEVMKVAMEECLTEVGRKHSGWWTMCKDRLAEACAGRDAAFMAFNVSGASRDSPEARSLRRARAKVQCEVRSAKRRWIQDRLMRIEDHDHGGAPINPADAWRAMEELERGLGELAPPSSVPLRNSEGVLATTPSENLEIFLKHFHGVFNRTSTYDRTVLEELEQRETMDSIGRTPSLAEVREIFSCAKNNKAAGLSGTFIELYKSGIADDAEICARVHSAIAKVWESGEIPEHWKEGKLKEIGKGGGKDMSNPSNYRGIMLLDVVSKVISALINRRLQELLVVHGRESQNGFTDGRGCRDSSFALRLALQTLREHGNTSWVAFIDLVKAFDSVDREAMCDVLLRYGAPESLVRVVRAMHEKVIVVLKSGDAEERFDSTLGVIQGAAASPTLFLFMIAAWLESADWKGEAIPVKSASQPGDTRTRASLDKDGRFVSHLLGAERQSMECGSVEIRDFLYADDAALVFESRESMEAGLTSLIASGKRWGLEVHAATSPDGKSKTEFMAVRPPPGHPNRPASFDASPVRVGDGLYITLAVSKVGGVAHENCFKYLGSYIDGELSDDLDVENRISGASKAFGRFRRSIFRNKKLGKAARVKAFRAFVLSILFYQSECWALTRKQRDKICCFYNRCVRSMARITSIVQWRKRITTCALSKSMGLLPCEAELDRRCLAWAGHVVRMKHDRLARQMLWAWHTGNRKGGRPQLSIRHRFDSVLKDMAASVKIMDEKREPENRRFTTLHWLGWICCAQERGFWRALVLDHVECVSDHTVRPERIKSRRVGTQTLPVEPRLDLPPGHSDDAVDTEQTWSREWWVPQERTARPRSDASTAADGVQTWSREWWVHQERAERSRPATGSEVDTDQSWSEEWWLPQARVVRNIPREGFFIDTNGVRSFRFADTTVSVEQLPRQGDFFADNGIRYHRYTNGAIVVRPWNMDGSDMWVPLSAPYTPPRSFIDRPWSPPPPTSQQQPARQETAPPPTRTAVPPPPSLARRPPSERQAALRQRQKTRSHHGER